MTNKNSIWHPISEQPKATKDFMVVYFDTNHNVKFFDTCCLSKGQSYNFGQFAIKWVYTDDIENIEQDNQRLKEENTLLKSEDVPLNCTFDPLDLPTARAIMKQTWQRLDKLKENNKKLKEQVDRAKEGTLCSWYEEHMFHFENQYEIWCQKALELKEFITNEVKSVIDFYADGKHFNRTWEQGFNFEELLDEGEKARGIQSKIKEVLK